MIELVHNRQEQLVELCREHGVRTLALFGSALTDRFEPARSDLDFAVEFLSVPPAEHARRYFALHRELENLFGTKVDLVEMEAVRNPFVKREIESTQEAIYAA